MNMTFQKKLHLCGFLALCCYFIPYFVMGEQGVYLIHDGLEVDIPYYLLNAKYFWEAPGFLVPEIMNGVGRQAIQISVFWNILLYALFPPIVAYLINYFTTACIAYFGMYLLLRDVVKLSNPWINVGVSLLFAILPFYPTWGLTVMGLPMLIAAFVYRLQSRWKWRSLGVVLAYGFSSSLIYGGYIVLGLLFLAGLFYLFRKQKQLGLLLWGYMFLLAGCYLITHFHTFYAVLLQLTGEYTSHRVEWVPTVSPFGSYIKELLKNGQYHFHSLPQYIRWFCFFILVLSFVLWRGAEKSFRHKAWLLLGLLGAILIIALFAGAYQSELGLQIRRHMGSLLYTFQAHRIYALLPVLWYVAFAVSLWLLEKIVHRFLPFKKAVSFFCIVLLCAAMAGQGCFILSRSKEYKATLKRMLGYSDVSTFSWKEFYSPDLMEKIAAYIGKPQDEYRVASLGISPAIALYNGFYCLDAYSVNYDLAYKRDFRQIIAPELEKREDLRIYFDEWGSRCYLYSAEIGEHYFIRNGSTQTVQKWQIDTTQLKAMGCEYLFSAVPIENASEISLNLMNIFESKESPWKIYLYEVH